jgi:hypothetical protein
MHQQDIYIRAAIVALAIGTLVFQPALTSAQIVLHDSSSTSDNPFSLSSLSGANSSGGSPVLGSLNASVTVVDFSDFQYPNCARYVKSTEPEIKSEYIDTGNVAYVFEHFPWRGTDSL